MNAFSYTRAREASDTVGLGSSIEAKYLGGGTNLVDLMREAIECPSSLVDITALSTAIDETEETEWDERNGRMMNPSLAEYHVPVHMDVPAIDVIWTDIPDPHAPMGADGIGEIGIRYRRCHCKRNT